MDQYVVLGRLGEGTHGVVFRAKCKRSGHVVALKRLPFAVGNTESLHSANHTWDIPLSTLRELFSLQQLQQPAAAAEEDDVLFGDDVMSDDADVTIGDNITRSAAPLKCSDNGTNRPGDPDTHSANQRSVPGDDVTDGVMTSPSDSHIVRLFDWFHHGLSLMLVLEYMPGNLSQVIYDPCCHLPEARVKRYTVWLLDALAFVHERRLIHRDVKPANLLVDARGRLKLADLGLCRPAPPAAAASSTSTAADRPCTPQVASRWYRAPELLYGSCRYTSAVDLWSAGCVLAELWLRWPLFRGHSDLHQLVTVNSKLGWPSVASWPQLLHMPDYHKLPAPPSSSTTTAAAAGAAAGGGGGGGGAGGTVGGVEVMTRLVPEASPAACAFLASLLVHNPQLRATAQQALQHDYLYSRPLPAPPHTMPTPRPASAITATTAHPASATVSADRRQQQQQQQQQRLCASVKQASQNDVCYKQQLLAQPTSSRDHVCSHPAMTSQQRQLSNSGDGRVDEQNAGWHDQTESTSHNLSRDGKSDNARERADRFASVLGQDRANFGEFHLASLSQTETFGDKCETVQAKDDVFHSIVCGSLSRQSGNSRAGSRGMPHASVHSVLPDGSRCSSVARSVDTTAELLDQGPDSSVVALLAKMEPVLPPLDSLDVSVAKLARKLESLKSRDIW